MISKDMITITVYQHARLYMLSGDPCKSSLRLCATPYPNHPKGCPNIGKRMCCPPKAKHIDQVLNLSKPIIVVQATLAFGQYLSQMKRDHPTWTLRQLRNPLYWQGVVRAVLQKACKAFNGITILIPEAHGVHVFRTMEHLGSPLERTPSMLVSKIAIIGTAL